MADLAPPHRLVRVLPPIVHLENGTEEAKSECGRLDVVRQRTLSRSLPVTSIKNGQRPSWCQLVPELRMLRHQLFKMIAPVVAFGWRAGMISMESLILAQDERWRRA